MEKISNVSIEQKDAQSGFRLRSTEVCPPWRVFERTSEENKHPRVALIANQARTAICRFFAFVYDARIFPPYETVQDLDISVILLLWLFPSI